MLRFTLHLRAQATRAVTLCAGLFVLAHVSSPAADAFAQQKAQTPSAAPVVAQTKDEDAPPYREYKGVRIGMACEEARKLLGNPADKGDAQDFYVFSESETAQVFYDKEKKVFAIAAIYLNGTAHSVPTPKAVLGDIAGAPTKLPYSKEVYA
ncbi:MAG TPA: hypothetical protein VF754_05440, partial [Pyrinomonadaceae bacterium]